jgi:hypothetical protein
MIMARTPVIIGLAAVASAAILGGSAVAVSEIGHQPPAAVKAVPAPTKTVIKHKTKIVHDAPAAPAPAQADPAAAAPGSLRPVGGGIFAGASTSDAFAQNVAGSYAGYPGEQQVYSPVTGQDYWMTYRQISPSTVEATGGNGALVQFPG